MQLPKNILSGNYCKPRIFLCETDKTKICQLETTNTNGTFRFNSISDLNFEVARVYNDIITGQTKVFPYYDKIEALRLAYLEGFGYFEIQGPDLISDGIKESKSITAKSLEYTLAQKYLENFYINTGEVDSVEVIYAEEVYGAEANNHIVPVTFYNPNNKRLSLLHLALEKIYGWKIGHVDSSLKTLSRKFEIDRQSVYDFLMNEVCEKFNCYIEFDTINNEINIYAESLTSKFIGDGVTNKFTISPPFAQIGTVSINGYKTTQWKYNSSTGALTLDNIPESGASIEVIDGGLQDWETDVFISFDNLSQEVNVSYDADSIKTVLTVTYGDDGNIREANLGLPYLTDISYYYTVDWLGQDLYDAYTAYLQKWNSNQTDYTERAQNMVEISNEIDFEENRLSLGYSEVSVFEDTVGTYYVRGGTSPNYYYTEVSLPTDYNANTQYYSMKTTNLNEDKVNNLYSVLKKYFNNENEDNNSGDTKITSWKTDLNELSDSFSFMEKNTLSSLSTSLQKVTSKRTSNKTVKTAILNFLNEMWEQVGRTPLKSLYLETYKTIQSTNVSAGWAEVKNNNYGYYYPVTIFIKSLENEIASRDKIITSLESDYFTLQQKNLAISNSLLMSENFTEGQLIRLNAFLREDELQLDDIVETDQDSLADSMKIKQDAMESGRIELQKLCQPQLQFSMTMANIYALSEFNPIVNQFQLGNVIKVGLRSDYIKQSRLLEVNLNFDDFSDFSCTFGELTSLRSQSDIHADLLSQAISAGKSVATNSSYWTKGSEQATATDLKIQQGLLDAATAIKSIDGTQEVSIDKYGIHLKKKKEDSEEYDDKQGWIVNNQFLYSDDAFETTKSVFGEYTVDGQTYWGLLAEAVIAGYIEGSDIVGCDINIGNGAFVVDGETGIVTMGGTGHQINGYATSGQVEDVKNQIQEINNKNMYSVEVIVTGQTVITSNDDKAVLSCKVYSWDTDITDTLDASYFKWKKVLKDLSEDEIWNAMPEHQGIKEIEINAGDIYEKASFYCEVELPD